MPRLALDSTLFELPEGETVVGSGAQADWRVQGRDLVARHFALRVRDGVAWLHPSSPDSVVAVDGSQVIVEASELVDGSRIDAGSASFLYWAGQPRAVGAAPSAAPPAHLVDERWQTAYPLTRISTGIGRDPSNAVVVRDPTASRFHAEIRREAGGHALHAMGSSGTRLNGTQMTSPRLLREGDRIEIAFATLRYTGQPLSPELTAVTEPQAVDPELAMKSTMQRERISLSDLEGPSEKPRSAARLRTVGAIVVALAVVLFILFSVLS